MSRTTEYRYNVDGLLEELVCHNGSEEQVTRWEYGVDASTGSKVARADLVRAKVYPDAATDRVTYSYNRLGDLIDLKDQNGTQHVYEYDALGRMTFDKVPVLGANLNTTVLALGVTFTTRGETAAVTSYSNAAGTNAINEVGFTYNGFSQVTFEQQQTFVTSPYSLSVGYGYANAAGSTNTTRRTGVSYPTSRTIGYLYEGTLNDALSRVSSIVDTTFDPNTIQANYAWLGSATPVVTEFPVPNLEMSSITAAPFGDAGDPYASLDRFGRLQEARWRRDTTDIEHVQFGFDRVGNIRWRHNFLAESQYDEAYTYNGLYELQSLSRGNLNQNRTGIGGRPGWQEAWQYDEMGNWLGYTTAASAAGDTLAELNQTRSYNAANELLFINEANAMVAHDPAGNMTRVPRAANWNDGTALVAQSMIWDAWNRITFIDSGSGSGRRQGQYKYDALHRRIANAERIGTTVTNRIYLYSDQWQILEQQIQSGSMRLQDRQFVWGVLGIDDLVLRDLASTALAGILYSLTDGKNVVAVTDTVGDVKERYAYHGFGFSEVLDAGFAPVTGSQPAYRWETRFCGYRWDVESELYQVRFRSYHPMLGRWLSRDPILEHGGTNLFAYVHNSPIRNTDRKGLLEGDVIKDDELTNSNMINCLGFALGINEFIEPANNGSIQKTMEKRGWNCVAATDDCKCDCAKEDAIMLYFYIHIYHVTDPDKYWAKLSDQTKKRIKVWSLIINTKRGYDRLYTTTWTGNTNGLFYPESIPHGDIADENPTIAVDYHAIRRNCKSKDPATDWQYVPQQLKKENGDFSKHISSCKTPDSFWENKERILIQYC